MGRRLAVACKDLAADGIEVEQELSRPYSYVPRLDGSNHSAGLNIISLKDPHNARSIWYWRIEQPDVHQGIGALKRA